MSSDKKASSKKSSDKTDITRIEDLSEYLHQEDDTLSSEDFSGFDGFGDDELMDAKTDPNYELPEEFTREFSNEGAQEGGDEAFSSGFETPPDFTSLEDQENFSTFAEEEDFEAFESEEFQDNEFPSTEEFSESPVQDEDLEEDLEAIEEDFEEQEHFMGAEQGVEEPFESDSEDEFFVASEQEQEEQLEDPELSELGTLDFNSTESEDLDQPLVSEQEYTSKEVLEKTPLNIISESSNFTAPENFKELQKFAKNISYGNLASEGNPPFSIILRDVKYKEDAQDILILLKEFGIVKDEEQEETARKSLERGMILIPRLGEYAAITICHKLRRFDINILMGLTEEIHPPKRYDSDDSGIVSKYSVYNSRSHHYNLDKDQLSPSEILTSTTSNLEGHDIIEYIGIASENAIISARLLERSLPLEDELISKLPDYQQNRQRIKQIGRANQAAAASLPVEDLFDKQQEPQEKITLRHIQADLLSKLRAQSAQQKGNALIGVNFHVSPLGAGLDREAQYQVICSGSVVWVNKR